MSDYSDGILLNILELLRKIHTQLVEAGNDRRRRDREDSKKADK